MKPATINSLQALSPALIRTEVKTHYRARYQKPLMEIQKTVYFKLIKGIKAYSPEEIRLLSAEDKRSILYTQEKCWRIINNLKQQKLNNILNNILTKVFGNDLCGEGVAILTKPINDSQFVVNLHECEIPTMVIIEAFISKGLLPKNFLS